MAPPAQVALLAFLTGIAFLEYGVGLHAVVPYLVPGWGNPQVLKSKIVTSQRNEILSHFKVLARAPIFVPATLGVVYVFLLCAALWNTATDARKRMTHLFTLVLSIGAAVPFIKAFLGPAINIAKTGKQKLSPAQEVEALYDIALAVCGGGFLFLAALLQNLTADEEEEKPKKQAKKEQKIEKVE